MNLPQISVRALAWLGIALALQACGSEPTPTKALSSFAASDNTCAKCHAQEFERWTGSHHQAAMQVANEETVLGDFDDAVFTHFDQTTRFSRDGARFMVRTPGADGQLKNFEVAYTFGLEPLQQYLIEFDDGRMQCLSVAWDTENKKWFHLYPDEAIPPGDQLHWTGPYQRWNSMCAACHSTDLQRGFDLESKSYDTTWTEISVGCQACHGPGAEHVAWAENGGVDDGQEATEMGLIANLRRWAQQEQINACAPCHSRRTRLLEVDDPSQSFLDRFLPERLHAGFYYPDGQILDEVYVYGSFAQSKMYQHGVTCSDCHDPHATEMIAEGNTLCNQCHSSTPDLERFPTLKAKDYNNSEHHHHAAGSAGSLCVNCHMPETTYMQVDPRRDHSLRIPRPDISALLGTPNACNKCHQDQTNEWAAEKVDEWTGGEPRPWHFGMLLAAAQAGIPEAKEPLMSVAMDPEQSAILRATSLELLRSYGNSTAQVMLAACDDEDPLVRASAVAGLADLPADARGKIVGRMLSDPVRAVRIEAARVLADVPLGSLPERDRAAYHDAYQEFLAAQNAQLDMPSAHLNLGIVQAARGEHGSAQRSYRNAIELDPFFLPARFNLANLLNSDGRNEEAAKTLREAIKKVPYEGQLHFSLGLVLNEMNKPEEAAEALRRAADLLPEQPRVRYNLGLLLRQLGHLAEAEEALATASRALPEDAECLHALVLVLVDLKAWKRALVHAEELAKMAPRSQAIAELLQSIQAKVTAQR